MKIYITFAVQKQTTDVKERINAMLCWMRALEKMEQVNTLVQIALDVEIYLEEYRKTNPDVLQRGDLQLVQWQNTVGLHVSKHYGTNVYSTCPIIYSCNVVHIKYIYIHSSITKMFLI